MDFSMPNCDGPTATKLIREFLQGLPREINRPYICFLTAYNDVESRRVAKEAGGDDFFVKPIFKDKLHKPLQLKSSLILESEPRLHH